MIPQRITDYLRERSPDQKARMERRMMEVCRGRR